MIFYQQVMLTSLSICSYHLYNIDFPPLYSLSGASIILLHQSMIMYTNNSFNEPQHHPHVFNPGQNNTNLFGNHEEQMPEVKSKLKTFHIEIRNQELKQYKRRIREQQLRTYQIDDLLNHTPTDISSSHQWAQMMTEAYGMTQKYQLQTHQAVNIFKMVEKFPNNHTLQLLETIVLRANCYVIDALFQYDVMRLLHGFINYTGKFQPSPRFQPLNEEAKIMKEVVISSSTMEILERNSSHDITYLQRLELARITVRIIAHICSKDPNVRNFVVLNHKTYTYCLKAFKYFGEDIKLEFYMMLEAATVFKFERNGETHFERIANKIVSLFFQEKINVKIQLFNQQQERNEMNAYVFLVKAISNLLRMLSSQINVKILLHDQSGQLAVLSKFVSLISQCNYVLNFPTIRQSKQEKLPFKIMQASLEFISYLMEANQKHPTVKVPPYALYSQVVKFLQLKNLCMSFPEAILARRRAFFLLDWILCDSMTDNQLISLIYFSNDHNPQDNIIKLITFYLQFEADEKNVGQISIFLRRIFDILPHEIIQPLLLPSEMFPIMLDKFTEFSYMRGGQMYSDEAASRIMTGLTVEVFFQKMGERIGSRMLLYKNILTNYKDKLYAKLNQKDINSTEANVTSRLLSYCEDRIPEQL